MVNCRWPVAVVTLAVAFSETYAFSMIPGVALRPVRNADAGRLRMQLDGSGVEQDRRKFLQGILGAGVGVILTSGALPSYADLPQGRSVPLGARERGRGPEGVNRPELLPEGPKVNIIDLEKFLAKGQVKKIDEKLARLEEDTGYKFRVLCQRYPETPGLAIKDYWGVDDKTIVMVVDRGNSKSGTANILNFNVGSGVDLALPPVFFTRLRNYFGTTFYVKENGEDSAIINSIDAIVGCLRGGFCTDVPQDMKNIVNKGAF